MKISIGPYLDWWGPYQILGLLNKVGVSKDTTNRWAEASPEWFTDFCQRVHDKRGRKIKVKIHDYDTWSMDRTLAVIILPMLKQLKNTKHESAYLPVFDQTSNSSVQSCFDFYEEGDDAAWEEGHAQWEKIMDEMIWAFEQLQPNYTWEVQYTFESDEVDEKFGWKKATYDHDGINAHQARISAGLKLFGEHFENLWD